jgi:hypothetical protein
MPQILIRPDQRVTYLGKTESGKTYLARHVLTNRERLIVLDPKGTLGKPEWNLETGDWGKRQLLRGRKARIRVPYPLNGDWRPWLDLAWKARDVTVYIDEVYGVVPAGKRPPDEFVALYTRGRELGISVHAASQRPVWIPQFVLSEADWLFVFRLSRPQDRKYVAGFGDETGDMERPIRDAHGFWTYHQAWRHAVYTPRYVAKNIQQTPRGTRIEQPSGGKRNAV